MFPLYNKLEDVPEAFREHYKMSGGKAVPQVSTDHPLVVNNSTLKTEKETAERDRDTALTEAQTAKDDLAKAKVIPHGQRAVPVADAELIDKVKAAGITKSEEFDAFKTKHDELTLKDAEAEKSKHASSVGEAMGWDKEKTARLVPKVFDLSTVSLREKDGKKEVVAKVKQADGSFVEKPFADVVTATAELTDLLPSLSSEAGGTRVHGTRAGASTSGGDDLITKINKEREKERTEHPNALMQKPTAAGAARA
jgi:hypothetical protein